MDKGISSFVNAVMLRQDEVFDRLQTIIQHENQFLAMKPLCHRGCRSEYTHKRNIEKYTKKRKKKCDDITQDLSVTQTSSAGTSSSTRSTKPQIDYKACFICNKERDLKGNRHLFLIATEQRRNSIQEKAKQLNDQDILLKIQGHSCETIDMIAADYRYHKVCMDQYLNRRVQKTMTSSEDDQVAGFYNQAFETLIEEIDKLIKEKNIYFITQLRNRFSEIFNQKV